jgi:hypothetical protein
VGQILRDGEGFTKPIDLMNETLSGRNARQTGFQDGIPGSELCDAFLAIRDTSNAALPAYLTL